MGKGGIWRYGMSWSGNKEFKGKRGEEKRKLNGDRRGYRSEYWRKSNEGRDGWYLKGKEGGKDWIYGLWEKEESLKDVKKEMERRRVRKGLKEFFIRLDKDLLNLIKDGWIEIEEWSFKRIIDEMKKEFEFIVWGNKRSLGIDLKMKEKIENGEEKVEILLIDLGIVDWGNGLFKLRCLIGNIVEDGGWIRKVKEEIWRFMM